MKSTVTLDNQLDARVNRRGRHGLSLCLSILLCGCSSGSNSSAPQSPSAATGRTAGDSKLAQADQLPGQQINQSTSPSTDESKTQGGAALITESDIEAIESALKSPLPKTYRAFLLQHGGQIAELEKKSQAKGEYAVFPWYKTKEIIRENSGDLDFLVLGESEKPFGDQVFLISTNGGGDYSFVYRDESKPGIWYFDHETQQVTLSHKTFDEYLAKLLK